MPVTEVQLGVVIPSFRHSRKLIRLLDSLQRQELFDRGQELHVEVLVVCNRPDWRTRQLASQRSTPRLPIRYMATGKVGVNTARNFGLRSTSAAIIYLLDDDTELTDEQHLLRVWQKHQQNPEVLAIGGAYQLAPGAGRVSKAYHFVQMHWLRRFADKQSQTPALLGGNISFKRARLNMQRLYNENIRWGSAEAEFHRNLYQAGCGCLLDDDLTVRHHHRLGWGDLIRKAYRQGRNSTEKTGELDSVCIERSDCLSDDFFAKLSGDTCLWLYACAYEIGMESAGQNRFFWGSIGLPLAVISKIKNEFQLNLLIEHPARFLLAKGAESKDKTAAFLLDRCQRLPWHNRRELFSSISARVPGGGLIARFFFFLEYQFYKRILRKTGPGS